MRGRFEQLRNPLNQRRTIVEILILRPLLVVTYVALIPIVVVVALGLGLGIGFMTEIALGRPLRRQVAFFVTVSAPVVLRPS